MLVTTTKESVKCYYFIKFVVIIFIFLNTGSKMFVINYLLIEKIGKLHFKM